MLPTIHYCVVCEDVRREVNRKHTVVGFYGVTPWVTIKVRDFALPLDRLVFLFLGSTDRAGTAVIDAKLVSPENVPLVQFRGTDMDIPSITERFAMIVGVGNLRMPMPGKYSMILTSGTDEIYRSTFDVEQGQSGDFDA